jgi:hypothetical protein
MFSHFKHLKQLAHQLISSIIVIIFNHFQQNKLNQISVKND